MCAGCLNGVGGDGMNIKCFCLPTSRLLLRSNILTSLEYSRVMYLLTARVSSSPWMVSTLQPTAAVPHIPRFVVETDTDLLQLPLLMLGIAVCPMPLFRSEERVRRPSLDLPCMCWTYTQNVSFPDKLWKRHLDGGVEEENNTTSVISVNDWRNVVLRFCSVASGAPLTT